MGKTRAECSQNAYTSHASAFLSHWIQILANSSPKSDIKKKKKKKMWPCFFAFYGRSGEGNITIFFWGLMRAPGMSVHVCIIIRALGYSLLTLIHIRYKLGLTSFHFNLVLTSKSTPEIYGFVYKDIELLVRKRLNYASCIYTLPSLCRFA